MKPNLVEVYAMVSDYYRSKKKLADFELVQDPLSVGLQEIKTELVDIENRFADERAKLLSLLSVEV